MCSSDHTSGHSSPCSSSCRGGRDPMPGTQRPGRVLAASRSSRPAHQPDHSGRGQPSECEGVRATGTKWRAAARARHLRGWTCSGWCALVVHMYEPSNHDLSAGRAGHGCSGVLLTPSQARLSSKGIGEPVGASRLRSVGWNLEHFRVPVDGHGSTLEVMAMIELSERTVARLTVLAEQRGVTPAVIAEELVTAALPDPGFDHGPPTAEFDALVDSVIADHRELLDRLAAT